MTREELIPLIQEAVIAHPNANPFDFRLCELATIEHFAKLVAEAEREACAEVCDSFKFSPAADAIRARGKA
jgi:hypothetical protein